MWSFAGKVMILGGVVLTDGKNSAIEIIDVDNFSFTCAADPTFTPLPDSDPYSRILYFGAGLVPFPLVCAWELGTDCYYLDNG